MNRDQKLVRSIPAKWVEPLPFGDADPDAYPSEVVRAVFEVGLRHLRGAHKSRRATYAIEEAEALRRRIEINHIFRFLPHRLRERPAGKATKDRVLHDLEKINITSSEATLNRDYKALGGARALRFIQPASRNERYEPIMKMEDKAKPTPDGTHRVVGGPP